jgi:small-conductance mechanosensitive channel
MRYRRCAFLLLAAAMLFLSTLVWSQGTDTDETAPVVEQAPPMGPGFSVAETTVPYDTPVNDTLLTGDIEDFVEGIESAADTSFLGKIRTLNLLERLGIAAIIILIQILLMRLIWHLFVLLWHKTRIYGEKYFRPLKFKKYVLLETQQILNVSFWLIKILKYVVTLFQLFLTLPSVFSLFEPTKNLASTLFGYIFNPLKSIALAFVNYIPNLFIIAIIIIIARYLLRSLKFFSKQIERGKLVLNGFYPDWAQPTFNILRVLIYAFTIAMVYPYLPNSDSHIFQGVSVLLGLLFSLGSSSVVGNLVAGIVMTYMRPFKIGDRIKINDSTGFVVERAPMVTRIRTTKNEIISFPNQVILNANITNYTQSASSGSDGLILHADVTMGYDIPWTQVHEILISAALKTRYTQAVPKPFVLQKKLDDFYCNYEINVYTKEIGKLNAIYSDLYEHIQDGFAGAGISLFAPHYAVYTAVDEKEANPSGEKRRTQAPRKALPDTPQKSTDPAAGDRAGAKA